MYMHTSTHTCVYVSLCQNKNLLLSLNNNLETDSKKYHHIVNMFIGAFLICLVKYRLKFSPEQSDNMAIIAFKTVID